MYCNYPLALQTLCPVLPYDNLDGNLNLDKYFTIIRFLLNIELLATISSTLHHSYNYHHMSDIYYVTHRLL